MHSEHACGTLLLICHGFTPGESPFPTPKPLLRYAVLGTGCTPVLQCLGKLSLTSIRPGSLNRVPASPVVKAGMKFIIRSSYDSDLQRSKISLTNIVS